MTTPWTQAFPSAWKRVRLRNLIDHVQNGVWGEEPSNGDGVVCIRAADFDREHQRLDESRLVRRRFAPEDLKKHLLRQGDLVLEKSGGGEQQPVGAVILFDKPYPAVATNFAARVRPSPLVDSRYLAYVLSATYALGINHRALKQTTGIQNLDTQAFFSEPWAVPSVQQQRTIADFLDRETTRIDALVERKQALISSLRDRVDSIVGNWTSGLLSSFGSIALKRLSVSIEQGWSPQSDTNVPAEADEWGILKLSAVSGGVFDAGENKRLPETAAPDRRWLVAEGDLLVVRGSGSRNLVGRACVAAPGSRRLLIPDLLYRVRLKRSSPWFVARILNSSFLRQVIESRVRTDAGQTLKVRADDLANLPIPAVEPRDQVALLHDLNARLEPMLLAQKRLEAQVTLLLEHRQALISRRVTGEPELSPQSQGEPPT